MVQCIPHRPGTLEDKTRIGNKAFQRRRIADDGKVQRCQSQNIDSPGRALRLFDRTFQNMLCQADVSVPRSRQITMDTVRPESHSEDACPFLYHFFNGAEIRPDCVGHGTATNGDKSRPDCLCHLGDIIDQPLIISLNGIDFVESGYIYHRWCVIPAWLIMGIIGRIAARCIVHDDQPAQFKQG